MLGEPDSSAHSNARTDAEQPGAEQEPASGTRDDLGSNSAAAQPAADSTVETQPPSHSAPALGAQHEKSALHSDTGSMHNTTEPAVGAYNIAPAGGGGTATSAGTSDGKESALPARQADNVEPAAAKDEPREQSPAAATVAGLQGDTKPVPRPADDGIAGSVKAAAEIGESRGHNMASDAPRDAEHAQPRGSAESEPHLMDSSTSAIVSRGTTSAQNLGRRASPPDGSRSQAMPDQETGNREGPAPGDAGPAPCQGKLVPQLASSEAELKTSQHGSTAAVHRRQPDAMPMEPNVSPPSSTEPANNASGRPLASPALQPHTGSPGRERAAMGAGASSGNAIHAPAADPPPQASPQDTASRTSKEEAPAHTGPSVSKSTSGVAAKVPLQASPSSAGRSTSKPAADPLQALLGDTQPRLARPPPRLTRPLSSGPLPRQSTSVGAAAGTRRSKPAASTMHAHSPAWGSSEAHPEHVTLAQAPKC